MNNASHCEKISARIRLPAAQATTFTQGIPLVSHRKIGYSRGQVMKLPHHIAVSIVVSALVWLWLRSATAALACFGAGVFVDLDHVIDYVLQYGHRIRPRHLFRAFEAELFDNIFVFLHAWEWILVGLVILWLIDWKPAALGLIIGFTTHLVLDHLTNRHNPWAYFITYRLAHRFSGRHYYGAWEYRKRRKHMKQMADHSPERQMNRPG